MGGETEHAAGGGADHDFSALPAVIHAMLHEDHKALDPEADRLLPVLRRSAAPEIWHKHGHFYSHLHDVWLMMCAWHQPQEVCRLGLFHSAYSNSFVSMNLFNPDTPEGRQELRDLIGTKAEELVWKFCVIDRSSMNKEIISTGVIPAEGKDFKHIRTGEIVHCSAAEIGAFVVETLADYQDQSFGWQSDLEEGLTDALWPGLFKPTLRMSVVSRMAKAAKEHGQLKAVPPIFDNCSAILSEAAEREARDLYWDAVSVNGRPTAEVRDELLEKLTRASQLNPFVAEPHTVRAQIFMQKGDWAAAADAAKAALRLCYQWATQWDNRMPFNAWVSWTRCILLQSSYQEWPTTHMGLESLGAVHAAQRFRDLTDAPQAGVKRKAEYDAS